MRVLQLTPRVAWPATDGGRVVMLQIARSLSRLGAEVTVLSLNPRRQRSDVWSARAALLPAAFQAIDIDTSAHATAFLRSFVMSVPAVVSRFYSDSFVAALRETLRGNPFDVVQIESPFMLPYVPMIRAHSNALVVLRSLNVEFRIWERLATLQKGAIRRAALASVARSLRRYEIAQLNVCDAIVPISERDAADYRTLGSTRPMHVLPAAVDMVPTATAGRPERTVGFLGSLDFLPNQDAARWIAEELLPRLGGGIELHVAGSRAPVWLRSRLAESAVVFHGEVPDAAAFIAQLSIVIAPIFAGGGMRVKILEAMAQGRPVVSTTVGAEGMDVSPGVNIMIANDGDSFASAIRELVADPALGARIGSAGRQLVNDRYSAEAATRGLLAFYAQQIAERCRVGSGGGA